MKINYPIKYVAMPIVEQVEWSHGLNELERSYDNVCYIVSKCYLLADSIRYKENGQIIKEYEVVFPYQYNNEYRVWEKTIPSFNIYSHGCINSNIVENIFDSYEEALNFVDAKNQGMLGKSLSKLPYTKDIKQKITAKIEEFNYMLAGYKMLEQQILYNTSDIKQSNTKELNRLISIKNNKVEVISSNLYQFLNFAPSNKFIVYSVSQEQYDKLKELTKEESVSDVASIIGPNSAILYHETKEPITRVINPNADGVNCFSEDGTLCHSDILNEVPPEKLDFIGEGVFQLYTTETIEDLIESFKRYEDIDLTKIQGSALIKKGNV